MEHRRCYRCGNEIDTNAEYDLCFSCRMKAYRTQYAIPGLTSSIQCASCGYTIKPGESGCRRCVPVAVGQ